MSFPRQIRPWMAAVFTVGSLATLPLAVQAADAPVPPALLRPSPPPPMPQMAPAKSPVDAFRELLGMAPAQRNSYLTNRPASVRSRILAKINEYEGMAPEERELRLRATELRWYLLPLLHASPADRAARLEQVPEGLQQLVKARLAEWDILPPPLQKEFLDNERALRFFTNIDSTNAPLPGEMGRGLPDSDVARWNALSGEQQLRMAGQFKEFFDLPAKEKQRTLRVLSDAERQEMETTLQVFAQLPPAQRRECVHAFTQFASMSVADKQEFLKNAARWSQMSPRDRQIWRDLVANVPPMPPMPPSPEPPMPPMPSAQPGPHVHPTVATNHN
jgi:hypothetical protein